MKINYNVIYIIFPLILILGCFEKKTVPLSKISTSKGVAYFDKHPFTGIGAASYNNNQQKLQINYSYGKKHGKSYSWYPDGIIKEKGNYKKGKKIGTYLGFWPSSNLRFKKNYKMGLLNGTQKQWHQNGILARLSNYKDGKEQGEQKGWRKNGDLRYNYQMINNRRYGFMGSKTCVPVKM